MRSHLSSVLSWAPRVCGILFALGLIYGAVGVAAGTPALGPGGFSEMFPPFRLVPTEPNQFGFWRALLFFLQPALAVVVALILSWGKPWLGALAFGAAGMGYAVYTAGAPLRIWLALPGPFLIMGLLYAAAWVWGRDRARAAPSGA